MLLVKSSFIGWWIIDKPLGAQILHLMVVQISNTTTDQLSKFDVR